MKLDVSPLEKALNRLEKSMNYLRSDLARNDPNLYEQFRNSAIQCFEFTYELTYKMLQRQLSQIVKAPDELKQMTFPEFIRTAADAGLITDVKRFLHYRTARNLTSHTYDEKKAEQVIFVLDEFKQDVQSILSELQKRN